MTAHCNGGQTASPMLRHLVTHTHSSADTCTCQDEAGDAAMAGVDAGHSHDGAQDLEREADDQQLRQARVAIKPRCSANFTEASAVTS